MTTGGWVIMLLSVGFVTGLLAWCITKVVTTPGSTDHLRTTPSEIDTGDASSSDNR